MNKRKNESLSAKAPAVDGLSVRLRFLRMTADGNSGPGVNEASDITGLLRRAESGEAAAHDALLPLIYEEFKRVARSVRHGKDAPTLNTTALVHETYLRLIGSEQLSWPDRHSFFAYAARTMRNILIDRARAHLSLKRGGDLQRVEWDEVLDRLGSDSHLELLELDASLTRLEQIDANLARVVELHVFAGLDFADVGQCMGIGERSAFRAWHKAKAVLHSLLVGDAAKERGV